MLDLAAAFIALTTLLTYINYRFIGLPATIGVMAMALLLSLLVHLLAWAGYPVVELELQELVRQLDFSEILMTWFLPALLFAGALHVNLADLARYRIRITALATVGVLAGTLFVAILAWYLLGWFGWEVSFLYCLLFGALISPTDPIAVMGILRSSGAPKPLRMTIVGESLFNDGTAVVLFGILLSVLTLGETPTIGHIGWLFVQEGIGGILFGLVLGYGVFFLLRTVQGHQISVMLTLALVFGGAAAAVRLHVSAPLVMVVAGLIIGNLGRMRAMTDTTRQYVDSFWELIDEILNALLFALIGLELLILPFGWLHSVAAMALGAAVLVARWATLAPGIALIRKLRNNDGKHFPPGTIRILTWGGLRGGVSVALALALPAGPERDLLLALTYIIVLVSILVQGLTIGPFVRKLHGGGAVRSEPDLVADAAPSTH